jgi:hypothetical protein
MHETPGKGGCSQSAFNLRTSCAHLGLAHHHPPPQRLAIPTPIFLPGAQPKRMPTLFTPPLLSRAIAHTVVYPVHPPPYPTQLYLYPLINLPLIPLPHIMGTPPCSNRNVTGTHPQGLSGGDT